MFNVKTNNGNSAWILFAFLQTGYVPIALTTTDIQKPVKPSIIYICMLFTSFSLMTEYSLKI